MKMPDKQTSLEDAIAHIKDGDTIMVGGFGVPGTPMTLIRALVDNGAKDLTLIKNDANEPGMGIDHLLQNGQVKRLTTTHLGLNSHAIELMNAGKLEVEFNAQGILAERIRAGGAGLGGVLSDIGVGTELADGKQTCEHGGKTFLIESALRADIALLHADTADAFGNLRYCATARNFNPLMAMAADRVVVEAETLVSNGELGADDIHTTGIFVDQVVQLQVVSEEYAVVQR